MGRLFGTDGVRGIANKELTCELAMKIGRSAALVISRNQRRHPKFIIGMDTRISSRMLASAVISGLCSVGADVTDLGVISTPAVAFLIGKYKADAGIMISASHNTYEYNGIKIFSGDGYKLPDALEEQIESLVFDEKDITEIPQGMDVGTVTHAACAVKDYVEHLKSTVPFSLSGMKVAVDCANGSASVSAEKLFSELGAECHMLFCAPDGKNINDGCGSTHPEALKKYVKENGMDVGVAFDGDADRCFCVDDKGNIVDGDFIMAICALDMKARGKLAHNSIVGTVLTNMGFVKFCESNGISFVATKVGDRFVLEQMLLEDLNFGGEQSGHIIFRDFAGTGDGQLTAVQLLSQLKRTQNKLSDLTGCMTKFPQIQINVKVTPEGKLSFYTDEEINKTIADAKKQLGSEGRLIVRASGTEPLIRVMAEHQDAELAKETANRTASVIKQRIGII